MIWLVEAGEGRVHSLQWPVQGTFFRLQVYERVGTSLVDVCERLEISVV